MFAVQIYEIMMESANNSVFLQQNLKDENNIILGEAWRDGR